MCGPRETAVATTTATATATLQACGQSPSTRPSTTAARPCTTRAAPPPWPPPSATGARGIPRPEWWALNWVKVPPGKKLRQTAVRQNFGSADALSAFKERPLWFFKNLIQSPSRKKKGSFQCSGEWAFQEIWWDQGSDPRSFYAGCWRGLIKMEAELRQESFYFIILLDAHLWHFAMEQEWECNNGFSGEYEKIYYGDCRTLNLIPWLLLANMHSSFAHGHLSLHLPLSTFFNHIRFLSLLQ